MTLRVLSFTTIYPNAQQPGHGLFVRERVRALARLCELRVMAPVPWVPAGVKLPARYRPYAAVAPMERQGDLTVFHPRFLLVPKLVKALDPFLMASSCARQLAEVRRDFPFDVIDAHWGCPDGVAAVALGARSGVPVSVTVRGDDINVFANERGRRLALQWGLRRAAQVVALSQELKTRVEALGVDPHRVSVIPNGVDGARFRPEPRVEARRRLGIADETRLLLSVGRLHQSKGFPVLVESVAALNGRFPKLQLVIIGEPDPEADATPAIRAAAEHHRIATQVRLTGAQPPDALVDWYNAADLFCLATSREGSANVLLEALACGLPCVTTPVGGNPDIITTRELGSLTDPEPIPMAEAIADGLARHWDREHISRVGRSRTWGAVADQCLSRLSEIVRAGGCPACRT